MLGLILVNKDRETVHQCNLVKCSVRGKTKFNEKVIAGLVKEKEEAKKEFDEAVKEGKTASLLSQTKDDVFRIDLGNIPSQGDVVVTITYVQDLVNDATEDTVRFALPTAIAPRYGSPPEDAKTVQPKGRPLEADIDIESSVPILTVESPSHPIQIQLGNERVSDALQSRYASVTFGQHEAKLEKDFVLIVRSKNLNSPRAFFEYSETWKSYAMMLTMVPRFALNPIVTEVLFLVDRSGSMEGLKMTQTKAALNVFLHSLTPDTFFNIVSFGNDHKFLFEGGSVPYTQENLKAAKNAVESFDADMGGTEIFNALQSCLNSRRLDVPTQVFILTDGEVWDVDRILDLIKNKVKEYEGNGWKNFLRVFSLGIGDSVSHQLVSGIARMGQGYAAFVGENENLQKKVVKMLKVALLPPLQNYEIEWFNSVHRQQFELLDKKNMEEFQQKKETLSKKIMSLFSAESEPSPKPKVVKPLPSLALHFQQSPNKVPPIYPNTRFTIFSIIKDPIELPNSIKIKASSPEGPFELEVLLETSYLGFDSDKRRDGNVVGVLHTLAAKKLIQDLQDGCSYLHDMYSSAEEPVPNSVIRDEIVKLGTRCNLLSAHTSFIAIDQSSKVVQGEGRMVKKEESVAPRIVGALPPPPMMPFAPVSFSMPSPAPMLMKMATPLPGAAIPSVCALSAAVDAVELDSVEREVKSTEPQAELTRVDDVYSLIELQNFDGSFELSDSLLDLAMKGNADARKAFEDLASKLGLEIKVIATIIAMLTFAGRFRDSEDEWELVSDKAERWALDQLKGDRALLCKLQDECKVALGI